MTVVEHIVRYRGSSTSTTAGRTVELDLETAEGCDTHPVLAEGFVAHPHSAARALLLVAKVASTRYWTPPNMVAAAIAAADPVVTAWPGGLRFESFSLCCGVYARFDLDAGGFDGTIHRHGTTNIDVSSALKAALARIGPADPLLLRVGIDEVRVSSLSGQVVEKQVPLPERWVRGFAESAAAQSGLEPAVHLAQAGMRRFLEGLPTAVGQTDGWITPSGSDARWSTRPAPGAIAVGGAARLRVLREVAPLMRSLTGYGARWSGASGTAATSATSAWVGEVPGGRVTLAISTSPSRGFSGEGSMLHALAAGRHRDGDHVHIDRIEESSAGRWGYDVSAAAWFRRDLPFDRLLIERPGSRLANARLLVEAGAVELDPDRTRALVTTGSEVYRVRLAEGAWRCTCPWWGRHGDARGPCKHVLATAMLVGRVT